MQADKGYRSHWAFMVIAFVLHCYGRTSVGIQTRILSNPMAQDTKRPCGSPSTGCFATRRRPAEMLLFFDGGSAVPGCRALEVEVNSDAKMLNGIHSLKVCPWASVLM